MTARTGFSMGQAVRVRASEAPRAARRFRDRVGTVIVANRAGEVGVSFGGPTSWFRPRELTHTRR